MRNLLPMLPLMFAAACASGNAAQSESQLSGVQGERSFAAADFDRVALRGADNVVVRVGPAASVSARGDTAILDRLEIEVVDGELRVGRKSERGFSWGGKRGHAVVTVTLPRLVADSAELDVAGSGNARIAGRSRTLALNVAGSGNAEAGGFRAQSADVSIAGSGNAAVTVDGQAKVSVVGSGNADILGNAKCAVSKLGSGSVRCGGAA